MSHILSVLFSVICIAVILFQICLIAGVPWGAYAQGGQHEKALPVLNRVFAGLSINLLTAMGLAIISVAGYWPNWPRWTGWAVVGIQTLSTLLNCITPSIKERLVWAPITSLMLASAIATMLSV